MAEINYTGDVYSLDTGGQNARDAEGLSASSLSALGGMASFLGATASLALVIGVGVWGYKLMVRDVSGVPVVRALEGPMRIQPDDPGGTQADHQGLAVNAVAAVGTATPTADRVMLAPRPVALTDEDAAIGQAASQHEPLDSSLKPELVSGSATAPTEPENAVVAALVEELTAGVVPIAEVASSETTAAMDIQPEVLQADPDVQKEVQEKEQETAEEVQLAVVTGPGLKQSLRPQARPARAVSSNAAEGTDAALSSAIDAAVDTVASLDVDPDSLPAGTRLAQLGAFESSDIAKAEWEKLGVRFEEYLEGKQRVIQKASSGGRTFYRLRALGFEDLNDARRFCSALVSENADCIPVTTR